MIKLYVPSYERYCNYPRVLSAHCSQDYGFVRKRKGSRFVAIVFILFIYDSIEGTLTSPVGTPVSSIDTHRG